MSGDNSLWCNVLRRKYGRGNQDSNWDIGNGESVDVWHDVWLPSGAIANTIATTHDDFPAIKVADLIMSNGDWNIGFLSNLVPQHDIDEIVAIHLPRYSNGDDIRLWKEIKQRDFLLLVLIDFSAPTVVITMRT
ncbi:unnamed protein product [Vicia faba]|uniref:Uncharacterized protein n=1 Tax=Vicia faba TaxID=3906 RepID=A0AAV1A129_VICFA|nr:unnamed protein product [Vicia faba]